MSIKEDLIGEQFVKGNLKNFLQTYHLYYYQPEKDFPTSKVRLSLFGKENGEPRMIRSLYFENIENHNNFIINNLLYNLYWLEKQGIDFKPDWMPVYEYRKQLLEGLLMSIRKKLIKKTGEKLQKIRLTVNR